MAVGFQDFIGQNIVPGDVVVYSTREGTSLVLAKVVRCEVYARRPRVVVNRFREGKRQIGTGWYGIDPEREVRLTRLERVLVITTSLQRLLLESVGQ